MHYTNAMNTANVSSRGVEIPSEFKAVPGISDRWVSRDGRVMNQFGRILGNQTNGNYLYVFAYQNGKRITPTLGKVVAWTYLGDPGRDYRLVYKDGDMFNVHVDNLQWELLLTVKKAKQKAESRKVPDDCVPIPGHAGFYINRFGHVYNKKGRPVSYHQNKLGYIGYSLAGVRESAHRLVAKTFLPNQDNKPQVNHINSKPWDNRVENLEWATPQENMDHAWANTRTTFANGHWNAKLTREQVLRIQDMSASGMTDRQIADVLVLEGLNITRSHVYHITSTSSWGRVKAAKPKQPKRKYVKSGKYKAIVQIPEVNKK